MRKQDRERFVKGANKLIESLGAKSYDGGYDWLLDTVAGPLGLTVSEHSTKSGPGVVYGRFIDESPMYPPDANPHSGKWNHHYFHPWAVKDALSRLESKLRSML